MLKKTIAWDPPASCWRIKAMNLFQHSVSIGALIEAYVGARRRSRFLFFGDSSCCFLELSGSRL